MRTLKHAGFNLNSMAHAVDDHAVVQAADDLASGFLTQERKNSVDKTRQTTTNHRQSKAASMGHMLAIAFTD